ncbi:serine/threonine protein kinase [Rubripirellula obstinata]|uniref:serine/threonine protein kinase n=1 Tax=Rubripirellula obstinata TaxID=406547 RepID=UPI001EE47437|nr:protein kinase [Rubripirellula obstinata]
MSEVTNPQQTNGTDNRFAPNCPIVGIWRVGQAIHQSEWATLSLAQPADAIDSPRWDYVIKTATNTEAESVRQIDGFVAAAANVMHPNLVAVLDSSSNSQMPYLVMPKLEGESMDRHLTASPAKKLPVALWLVRQTAQALDSMHESGWIHGDVKPENVMVGPRGHATLVDLGFATRIHSVRNRLFRGTPDYASPESMSGQHAALPAMDVFSLGRMLWQWMARIEPVSQVVLEPVADLVETMIAENPADRPAASTVVKQLLRLEIETLGRHIGPGEVQHQQRRAA